MMLLFHVLNSLLPTQGPCSLEWKETHGMVSKEAQEQGSKEVKRKRETNQGCEKNLVLICKLSTFIFAKKHAPFINHI